MTDDPIAAGPPATDPPAAGPLTAEQLTAGPFGRIDRLAAELDQIVPAGAELQVIFDAGPGNHWLEGPAWDWREGRLLFSDTKANTVFCWHPAAGVSVFLDASGWSGPLPAPMQEPGSNGLAFDGEGRLLLCEHGRRRVTRLQPDGTRTVLASHWQGRPLNSPNDLVCRRNGEVWFTDPPYGLPGQLQDPGRLPVNGVYRITPSGTIERAIDGIAVPNGLGFSPAEDVLYVTDGGPDNARWLAFPIDPAGRPGAPRVLFDAKRFAGLGGPDGLAVDAAGNIFATARERVFVLSGDGRHLGSIHTGAIATNATWGEDGGTLFITTERRLLRLRLIAGATAG